MYPIKRTGIRAILRSALVVVFAYFLAGLALTPHAPLPTSFVASDTLLWCSADTASVPVHPAERKDHPSSDCCQLHRAASLPIMHDAKAEVERAYSLVAAPKRLVASQPFGFPVAAFGFATAPPQSI